MSSRYTTRSATKTHSQSADAPTTNTADTATGGVARRSSRVKRSTPSGSTPQVFDGNATKRKQRPPRSDQQGGRGGRGGRSARKGGGGGRGSGLPLAQNPITAAPASSVDDHTPNSTPTPPSHDVGATEADDLNGAAAAAEENTGGAKSTASELAADKFLANLMADNDDDDDSEEKEKEEEDHSAKEASAALPGGAGSTSEAAAATGDEATAADTAKEQGDAGAAAASSAAAEEVVVTKQREKRRGKRNNDERSTKRGHCVKAMSSSVGNIFLSLGLPGPGTVRGSTGGPCPWRLEEYKSEEITNPYSHRIFPAMIPKNESMDFMAYSSVFFTLGDSIRITLPDNDAVSVDFSPLKFTADVMYGIVQSADKISLVRYPLSYLRSRTLSTYIVKCKLDGLPVTKARNNDTVSSQRQTYDLTSATRLFVKNDKQITDRLLNAILSADDVKSALDKVKKLQNEEATGSSLSFITEAVVTSMKKVREDILRQCLVEKDDPLSKHYYLVHAIPRRAGRRDVPIAYDVLTSVTCPICATVLSPSADLAIDWFAPGWLTAFAEKDTAKYLSKHLNSSGDVCCDKICEPIKSLKYAPREPNKLTWLKLAKIAMGFAWKRVIDVYGEPHPRSFCETEFRSAWINKIMGAYMSVIDQKDKYEPHDHNVPKQYLSNGGLRYFVDLSNLLLNALHNTMVPRDGFVRLGDIMASDAFAKEVLIGKKKKVYTEEDVEKVVKKKKVYTKEDVEKVVADGNNQLFRLESREDDLFIAISNNAPPVDTSLGVEENTIDTSPLRQFGRKLANVIESYNLAYSSNPHDFGGVLFDNYVVGDPDTDHSYVVMRWLCDAIFPVETTDRPVMWTFFMDTVSFDANKRDRWREQFSSWYSIFVSFRTDYEKLTLWHDLAAFITAIDSKITTHNMSTVDAVYGGILSYWKQKGVNNADVLDALTFIKEREENSAKPRAIFVETIIRFHDPSMFETYVEPAIRHIFAGHDLATFPSPLVRSKPPTETVPTAHCEWFILDVAGNLDYDRIGFRLQNLLMWLLYEGLTVGTTPTNEATTLTTDSTDAGNGRTLVDRRQNPLLAAVWDGDEGERFKTLMTTPFSIIVHQAIYKKEREKVDANANGSL